MTHRTPTAFTPVRALALVVALSSLTSACASEDEPPAGADVTDTKGSDVTLTDLGSYDTGAPDTSAPDVDVAAPCTPSCAGRQCGPDGCGGACGQCGQGQVCGVDGICTATAGKQAFGAACGVTPECAPTVTNASGQTSDNPQWPSCLDAQCASGACHFPYCTRQCQFAKDAVDNRTGEPIADGIEDEDVPNSCADAEDGPVGAQFRCVNVAPAIADAPIPFCVPGTAFAPCVSNADCPEGEVCDPISINGDVSPRCVGGVKDAATIGQPCSLDATVDHPLCASPFLCGDTGCSALCADDADCLTAGAACEATGACANAPELSCASDADCSMWLCVPNHPDAPLAGLGLCAPRGCEVDADCASEGFHCRTSPSFASVPPKWSHVCVADPPEANASLGDPCTNDPADAVVCTNPDLCYKGQCSAHCASNEDCDEGAGQVCATAEIPFDLGSDGQLDAVLPLNLCEPLPHAGPLTDCTKDLDCPADEVCAPVEEQAGEGAPFPRTIRQVCHKAPDSFGSYGDSCGAAPGAGECRIGFCITDDTLSAVPDLCSTACASASDCPASVTIGGEEHPSVCRAVIYGWNGTVKSGDDLYVPVCWPVGPGSNLVDCAGDLTCAGEDHACVAWPLATDPTKPGTVEYLCVSNRGPDGKPGAGVVGDPCELATDCASLLCLPDKGTARYCSAPCSSDADCLAAGPFMVCDPHVAIDRKDDALDVVTPLCKKAQSCTPCKQHGDCAAGFVCANVGGLAQASYRCAPACKTDEDCKATDGGPVCKASVNPAGTQDGVDACIPQSCP